MDKRKKPVPKELTREVRLKFYDDIRHGRLSLQDAVRTMRAISGMTQPEFARHRGVAVKIIRDLEAGTGNPTIRSLNNIAAIFGLEVAFREKPPQAPGL